MVIVDDFEVFLNVCRVLEVRKGNIVGKFDNNIFIFVIDE